MGYIDFLVNFGGEKGVYAARRLFASPYESKLSTADAQMRTLFRARHGEAPNPTFTTS